MNTEELKQKVTECLQTIFDPEIPVNIYELGLIYEINMYPENVVEIRMTLTAPGCPVAGSLPGEVERSVETIPEVKSAKRVSRLSGPATQSDGTMSA